jgi:hypothetical protein
MIGWKDSDDDGIFDVLDVPLRLAGTGDLDLRTREYSFQGHAQVQTLPNLNRSGTGNDMTINRVDRIEVRFGDGAWQSVIEPQTYRADLQFRLTVPVDVELIEVRAVDASTGVSSNILSHPIDAEPVVWQNTAEPTDVNADTLVTPIDALLIVNRLNAMGSGPLTGSADSPPFLDVNGDGFLSPIDALMVINRLNMPSQPAAVGAVSSGAESEDPARLRRCLAVDASLAWQTRRQDAHDFDAALAAAVSGVWTDEPTSDSLVLADFR